ncbi:hypothetical protein N9064_00625 [bacterium]|nr:hypothetical protein [bacterium]
MEKEHIDEKSLETPPWELQEQHNPTKESLTAWFERCEKFITEHCIFDSPPIGNIWKQLNFFQEGDLVASLNNFRMVIYKRKSVEDEK